MEQLPLTPRAMTLSELNAGIRDAVSAAFPDLCWIVAEVAECKCNQKGHCYLELVEKLDDRVVAQMRATIWSYEYRSISRRFESAAGSQLRPGMKILLLGAVSFHEVYGLSINIKDIDPAYTMGEMALKRRETIERLRREGIMDRNRALALPPVPQRIAVISSPTAAGYGDFLNQLDSNPHGYRFAHTLFPAVMQGAEAEDSITKALASIAAQKGRFDLVAIIRGGGSAMDLSCFDSYALAAAIARFQIPVVTGIGHEKDDTVADLVAHTKLKTPTAVAEFLIAGARAFEERIERLEQALHRTTGRLVSEALLRLSGLSHRLAAAPLGALAGGRSRIDTLSAALKAGARHCLVKADAALTRLDQAARHLDPAEVLKRGYSITRLGGMIIKNAADAPAGSTIETTLYGGKLHSRVEKGEQ